MTVPPPRRPLPVDADRPRLPTLPPALAPLVGLLLTAGAGALDWVTGAEISFSVFYLPAVALVAWTAGRAPALLVAAAAAVVWYAAERGAGAVYSAPGIAVWNAAVRLAIFALFAGVVAALRSASDRARSARDTDPETGATDPAAFYPRVELEYASATRGGPPFTLAYIDLGGAAGGMLAHGVAERAILALRRVLRGHDLVARPRDRELAVFLPDTPAEAVPAILERLGHAALTVAVGDAVVLGAATCAHPAPPLNEVIQRAYQLMYAAERHRGQVVVAHEAVSAPAEAAEAVPATVG